jgi:hypothetical protein
MAAPIDIRLNASEAAGYLLDAWKRHDSRALDCEFGDIAGDCNEHGVSAFELERRELVRGIADEMRHYLGQPGRQKEFEVCLNLLRHVRLSQPERVF